MSIRIAPWAAGLTLAFACATAGARMHQICFEVPPETVGGVERPAAVFGCAIDGSGYCTIAGISAGMSAVPSQPLSPFVQTPGLFKYYRSLATLSGLMQARVEFFDNGMKVGERTCTVNAQGAVTQHVGGPTRGAVLAGFSTDVSGLATTGIWKRVNPAAPAGLNVLEIDVPFDFVAVGGGAIGVDTPIGALITQSQLGPEWKGLQRKWRVRTSEAGGAAQPHQATAFAIGLHIEGLRSSELKDQMLADTGSSTPSIAANPSAQVMQPVIGGSVVLGGGVRANADSSNSLYFTGQFATVNAPVVGQALQCTQIPGGPINCKAVTAITGWRAESKDHVVAHPGNVAAEMLTLPNTILLSDQVTRFEVRGKHVAATSAVTAHPAVDAAGLRGEYALTGVGASVDWKRFDQFGNQIAAGNLLWKIEPRADLGGASVAAKDHIVSSPASITGFALGIKLVPPGTPPEAPPICCRRLP